MSRGSTIGVRLVVAAVVALASTLLGSQSAFAHSYVIATDPADGSTVQELPTSVSVTFNETIQNFEPVLIVTGPDQQAWSTGTVSAAGPVLRADLAAGGPPGAYTVAYRVVSADGHPVSGQLGFTVAAGSASSVGSTTTDDSASSTTASGTTASGPAPSTTASSSTASSTTASSTAPSSPASSTSVTSTSPPDPTAPSDGGTSWWLWVGVGLAVVVLAAAALVLARRPRRD